MTILSGKVALITGGGTGIGRGTVQLFVAQGAKVVIAGRREQPLKDVTATAPNQIGYVQMDLTKQADRHRALDFIKAKHGRLDILVNNAGNQLSKPFAEQSEDEIDEVIDTNVISTMKLIHRALPMLRESKGCVVNVSSTAGRYFSIPSMGMTTYTASRGGMNAMTRSLATELGPMGIRINAVAPGLTWGEVAGATLLADPARLEALNAITPLGRVGQPADIARAILFLATDEWITGQVLDSSGGWWLGGG